LPLCRHRSSFVLLPPPPTSPLFPYTTLFRSNRCSPGRSWQNLSRRVGLVGVLVGCPVPAQQSPQRRHAVRGGASGRRLTAAGQLDRKSTRLNSSHVSISYAVFCLKKKKKHTE